MQVRQDARQRAKESYLLFSVRPVAQAELKARCRVSTGDRRLADARGPLI